MNNRKKTKARNYQWIVLSKDRKVWDKNDKKFIIQKAGTRIKLQHFV